MSTVDTGTGTPAVFLHAGTGNARMWEHQIPAVTAAGFRFIAYDRSGQAPAADELEGVVTRLGLERFHLIGTAAGGIAAIDYALTHPQRLRSLVIANSIFGVQDADYLELGRRLRPAEFSALPPEVRELGPSYRAANPEGTRRWAELASHLKGQPVRNRITFAALETIKVPTLLLTGDADLYTPPAVLKMVEKHFSNCRSMVIAECGHSAYWEQPEAFNRAVLEFLKKN